MKEKMKKLVVLLLAAIFVCAVTGCGNTEEAKENASTQGEVAVNGQTVYPYEAVDYLGNSYIIEKEPEKIISVSPNMTELLFKLGMGEKLIGRSDYCDYPKEALNVESMGSLQTPDIEKMISLSPDLVIVSDMIDDQLVDKLKDVGISVLLVEDVTNIDQVYDMMIMVGAVVNKNSEMASLVDDMKETIESVETAVADLEAPSVYYVVSYGEYGDATPGGDTFLHSLITAAGGDNIGKDISGWAINLEEIIEKDPDVIILPPYYDKEFQAADHYKDLTAVKEGRVYVIDTNMCDRQGYRNAEAVETLAEIFHPEAFK